MGKVDDLAGRMFNGGMITVLKRVESESRKSRWLCLCKCGNTFTAYGFNLKSGSTKSCGCMGNDGLNKSQMRKPSISLYRLSKNDGNPYQNLANAIVAVAVDDYRTALQDGNERLLGLLERFFYSDWYRLLTDLSPRLLLDLLHKENSGNLSTVYY